MDQWTDGMNPGITQLRGCLATPCSALCTTCNESLETLAGWISHLLHEGHQRAARAEIGRWDKATRNCALVAYTNFPVSTHTARLALLQQFSTAPDFLVTDFVTIPVLPQVAVPQFDTRATEIAEKAGGAKVSINGQQQVQLRKAEDYHDFEWQALLSTLSSDSASAVGGGCGSDGEASRSGEQGERVNAKKRKERRAVANPQPKVEQPEPEPSEEAPSELRLQFDELCRSVEISDQEFNLAVQFLRKLEEVASTKMPRCKLYMFRTWHLKLRSLGGNELLLFIDAQGHLSGQIDNPAHIPYSKVIRDVFSDVAQAELQGLGMTFSRRDNKDVGKCAEFACSHSASGTQFTVRPGIHFWLFQEVQACRMLEYLATFDIRVKPLYALIFYWTNVNNIPLSDIEQKWIDVTLEPAALEWLIMLFLCHKKMVPTPREILDRDSPGRTTVIKDDVEMGFFADPTFATDRRQSSRDALPQEDSDDFLLAILELVEAFFGFCVNLSRGSWILNTRDGEIIETSDFVSDKPGVTKLTESEREAVMRMLRKSKFLSAALTEPDFVGLLHPLHIRHRFAFNYKLFINDVIPLIKCTARKLAQFLHDESNKNDMLCGRGKHLKLLFHEK